MSQQLTCVKAEPLLRWNLDPCGDPQLMQDKTAELLEPIGAVQAKLRLS